MDTMAFAWDAFRQSYFIPAPTLTEKNLPDQSGRVFIVTGGYAGCGKALATLLYAANGTVYIAGRSEDKAKTAIEDLRAAHPSSDGRLEFLHLDLSDLPSIEGSAQDFQRREQRLDVLTNNAGVMIPPAGSVTKQGHELQMGTNCLGPYLFTKHLTPLLKKTAASSPKGSVRVTWAASMATAFSPKGGVAWATEGNSNGGGSGGAKVHDDRGANYAQSKAANVLLAREFAKRYAKDGVVSNAWNPGNLRSELQRHMGWESWIINNLICYPTHFGGYTELFAGWSEEAGKEENEGKYIGPWGRFVKLRKDLADEKQAEKFWEWCEEETKKFGK